MQVLLLGQDPIPSTLDEVDDQEMQRKAVNSTGRHSSAEERVDSGGERWYGREGRAAKSLQ